MLPPPRKSEATGRLDLKLMTCFRLLLPLAFLLIPRALAQSNPTVAACGLPAQGALVASVTYTMTADCALTGSLLANQASITVTINGGGHTVSGGAFILFQGSNMVLNLNSVTIDGGRQTRTETLTVNTLNANNVSFINSSSGPAINVTSAANLTNVLLSNNSSNVFALGGNGSAVHAGVNTTHVWNNVVLRRNFGNGGAIALRTGATLTTNSCLTVSGNVPYDIYDPHSAWSDNSTGRCSGTIGNGGAAAIAAPALLACGLPAPGVLDVSATYRLSSDCQMSGAIFISEDVDIHIIGNGNTIRSTASSYHFYTAATSGLRLENVELSGVRIFNWGDLRADQLRLANTIGGIIINLGEARFVNSLFEDNSTSTATGRSILLAWSAYHNGFTSFTDSAFRNNHGGLGALQNAGATIELNGCVAFENNSPADYSGAVTDNRDPDCDAEIVNPVVPVPSSPPNAPTSECSPNCDLPAIPKPDACNLKLGAIGLFCRPSGQPPVAQVWRIRPNPEGGHLPAVGSFLLAVNQPQIDAVAEGLVACSADGRLAVRTGLSPEIRHMFEISPKYEEELKIPRRYIVISKGPTFEGKVHNLVLEHNLDGQIFGFVDTYGGPPAAECIAEQPAPTPRQTPPPVYAPAVQVQAAQPDGSIIHVVQPGDTISAMAVAYRAHQLEIIMANQLEHMGRWIYPGQELIIREAG